MAIFRVVPSFTLRRVEEMLGDIERYVEHGYRFTLVGQRRLLELEERLNALRVAAVTADLERGIVTDYEGV